MHESAAHGRVVVVALNGGGVHAPLHNIGLHVETLAYAQRDERQVRDQPFLYGPDGIEIFLESIVEAEELGTILVRLKLFEDTL